MKFKTKTVEENKKEVVREEKQVVKQNKKIEEPVIEEVDDFVFEDDDEEEEELTVEVKGVKESKWGWSEELFADTEDTPYAAYLRGDLAEKGAKKKEDVHEDYLNSENGLIDDYVDKLVEYFTIKNPQMLNTLERGLITKEEFLKKVIEQIKAFGLDKNTSVKVLEHFKKYMWSYDRLDELIDNPDISDIKVLAYDCVRTKVKGKRVTTNIRFKDKQSYIRFVDRVAIKNKVSISDQNAVSNFTDTTSHKRFIMRWNISTPFVNSIDTPYIHIRKIDKIKVDIPELINRGMMNADIARFLRYEAANSGGMLFTGKGASGKTTCMNALLDLIPLNNSGLVIQENEELFSKLHPDLMFQKTVLNKGEGKIEYSLQDLARNGLLVDLDYFIIGEIKGAEALYLLNAAYTGHKCWASVHGASSTEAMGKLVDYIKYNSDYSREDAMHMLTHLETVVFMKGYKVWEVSKIVGWDDKKEELIYKPIVVDGELVVNIGKHGEVLD